MITVSAHSSSDRSWSGTIEYPAAQPDREPAGRAGPYVVEGAAVGVLGDVEELAGDADVHGREVVEHQHGHPMRHGPILSHIGLWATSGISGLVGRMSGMTITRGVTRPARVHRAWIVGGIALIAIIGAAGFGPRPGS